jgi:hypothetical protein
VLSLVFGASAGQAQNVGDWKRVMTPDAVLVSQAIGWSLEGPVSAKEAAPVVFEPGVAPKPIATGAMSLHNVLMIDIATPAGAPNVRGLVGVIELSDRADHRVLARFETAYEITGGTYRVGAVETHPFYPDTPRVEAYFVPAGANIPNQSPYAMLESIRRSAIDPATTVDSAPRQYRVYLVGMDRLSPQADLGFSAVDANTRRTAAKSQSVRRDGWIVASLSATFALNGKNAMFFPIVYRPDGTTSTQRILMLFSSHYKAGAPAVAAAPAAKPSGPGTTLALPPGPPLSTLGQAFVAKGLSNQVAQP